MQTVSAVAQLNIDVLYAGFPGFPAMGEEVFSREFSIQLGGGPQVMIIALGNLGIPVKLGTFYTDDIQSWLGLKLLAEYGFTSYENLYEGSGHPTVVTSVFSFPEDRAFLAYNEQVNDSNLDEEKLYAFHKGSKVCFAPANLPVLRRLRQDGTILLFDTGWHEDLSLAKYEAILREVDVFTPNDKEALKMTGAPDVQSALAILANYVRHPVVKTGENGCVTIVNGSILQIPAVAGFKPVDKTGAGDNFLAGFAYGLYQGWGIKECMQMGNILGGHSTTALGCLNARLDKQQAMALYQKYYK